MWASVWVNEPYLVECEDVKGDEMDGIAAVFMIPLLLFPRSQGIGVNYLCASMVAVQV